MPIFYKNEEGDIRKPNINDLIQFIDNRKLGGIIYIIQFITPENEDITEDSIIFFRGKNENVGQKQKTWRELKTLKYKYIDEQE